MSQDSGKPISQMNGDEVAEYIQALHIANSELKTQVEELTNEIDRLKQLNAVMSQQRSVEPVNPTVNPSGTKYGLKELEAERENEAEQKSSEPQSDPFSS